MLSIALGHAADALCHCLGEVRELSATMTVRRKFFTIAGTDESMLMTADDQVSGLLEGGSAFSIHYRGGSSRGTNLLWEINGTQGDLQLTADGGQAQIFEMDVRGGKGAQSSLEVLPVPEQYRWAPPQGPSTNVAQAYTLFVRDYREGTHLCPTFEDAVTRHRMLDAIETAARQVSVAMRKKGGYVALRTEPSAEPRMPLSRERVLRAAVELADRGGVESLSMRKLGQELGVAAMSLYRHVRNKADMLDGMVDLVFGEKGLPRGGGGLESGHAPASDLSPRGSRAPHLVDRADGVAEHTGSSNAAASRRGDLSTGSWLLVSHGRPRVLPVGQLHLRIRPAAGELAVQELGGGRRGGGQLLAAVPRPRLPAPHRADH
jgi:hypothetical protein